MVGSPRAEPPTPVPKSNEVEDALRGHEFNQPYSRARSRRCGNEPFAPCDPHRQRGVSALKCKALRIVRPSPPAIGHLLSLVNGLPRCTPPPGGIHAHNHLDAQRSVSPRRTVGSLVRVQNRDARCAFQRSLTQSRPDPLPGGFGRIFSSPQSTVPLTVTPYSGSPFISRTNSLRGIRFNLPTRTAQQSFGDHRVDAPRGNAEREREFIDAHPVGQIADRSADAKSVLATGI